MAAQPYAKIDAGIVVNTQMIDPDDETAAPLDPAFTWVPITGVRCVDGNPIQIGCGYDGTNFNPIS